EGDEPTYTQPQLYEKVKAHPTPRQVWGARLVDEQVIGAEEVDAIDKEIAASYQDAFEHSKAAVDPQPERVEADSAVPRIETAVPAEELVMFNEALLTYPSDFTPHPRLAKQLERRREALGADGGIDWGLAETLAFASILN